MATARVLSQEDGKLNQSSVVTSRTRIYSDLDLTFTAKPNGEIYKKVDAAAVKQAIKNLILTNYYEKPFEPYFGTNIREMLFELADDLTSLDIKRSIKSAIETYEPRAIVQDVIVDFKDIDSTNAIGVSIIFQVINSNQIVQFNTTLVRLR